MPQSGWQPEPGHTQIRIWPGTPPDARPTKPETARFDGKIAGLPVTRVENVSTPTITVYSDMEDLLAFDPPLPAAAPDVWHPPARKSA